MNRFHAAALPGWLKAPLPGRSKAALAAAALLLICCSCYSQKAPPLDRPIDYKAYPIEKQVVVWKNPDSTRAAFQKWLNILRATRPQLLTLSICPNCDNDLILLFDPGKLDVDLQSDVVGAPGGSGNPSGLGGGNGPALFSPNFDLNIRDSSYPQIVKTPDKPRFDLQFPVVRPDRTAGKVIVAVFDSGLKPAGHSVLATAARTCLRTTANNRQGWNFVANNANTNDDLADQHGTEVTKMIMDQVQPGSEQVTILPVKLFDANGKGNFFNILCGVAYAAGAGAKIINGSFGFYHYADTLAGRKAENMMEHYLARYLGKYGMILVAAAGNEDPAEDATFIRMTGATQKEARSLDSNRFYPAYFAKTHRNIISVTTVSRPPGLASPRQNSSAQSVDVGVDCDAVMGQFYVFYDRLAPFTQVADGFLMSTITGSSFAAPVVTGRIAAHYGQLRSTTDKQQILKQLTEIPGPPPDPLLLPDPHFINVIVGGLIAPK